MLLPDNFQMHVLVKRMGFQVTKKLQVCVPGWQSRHKGFAVSVLGMFQLLVTARSTEQQRI